MMGGTICTCVVHGVICGNIFERTHQTGGIETMSIKRLPLWIRTCQECGHEQVDNDPSKLNQTAFYVYAERLCKRCKSPGLDYGSYESAELKKGGLVK